MVKGQHESEMVQNATLSISFLHSLTLSACIPSFLRNMWWKYDVDHIPRASTGKISLLITQGMILKINT